MSIGGSVAWLLTDQMTPGGVIPTSQDDRFWIQQRSLTIESTEREDIPSYIGSNCSTWVYLKQDLQQQQQQQQ